MPVKLKFYNSLFLTFLQLNCPLVFIYTEIVYVNIETIIILTKINNTSFTVLFFFLMEKHKKAQQLPKRHPLKKSIIFSLLNIIFVDIQLCFSGMLSSKIIYNNQAHYRLALSIQQVFTISVKGVCSSLFRMLNILTSLGQIILSIQYSITL